MMIGKGTRIISLLFLTGLLLFSVYEMRDFGKVDDELEIYDPASKVNHDEKENRTAMDRFFLDNSQGEDTSTNNVVTAIVFDYRGFDTLGEATVLFAAVTGVLIALRKAFPEKKTAARVKGGGRK